MLMNSSKGMSLRSFTGPKEEIISGTGRLEIAFCISRGISERDSQIETIICTETCKGLVLYLHEYVHFTSVIPINIEKKIAPV